MLPILMLAVAFIPYNQFHTTPSSSNNEKWPSMRPFQRKMAILYTALDLIYTLDFISDEDKARIISMTPKNKVNAKPIIARMAFNRAQGLEREIGNKILNGVEKLLVWGEKSHDQVCSAFVQNLFVSNVFVVDLVLGVNFHFYSKPAFHQTQTQEEVTGKFGAHPPLWIFNRRPIFLIYQVYYRGLIVDPNIFEVQAPRIVELPNAKPACLAAYVLSTWSPT